MTTPVEKKLLPPDLSKIRVLGREVLAAGGQLNAVQASLADLAEKLMQQVKGMDPNHPAARSVETLVAKYARAQARAACSLDILMCGHELAALGTTAAQAVQERCNHGAGGPN